MRAIDAAGRGRVKLEIEYCLPGKPFGSINCGHLVSSSWTDVGISNGVTLTNDVIVALTNTLYHWRVRTLRAPFGVTQAGITAPSKPAHGPWRRLYGQAVEADIRTLGAPLAVEFIGDGVGFAIERIPTPTGGAIALTVVLPSQERAKVELLDVAGRRVLSREFAPARAGRHTVQLSDGRGLASGIYLVRLVQAAERQQGELCSCTRSVPS